MLHVGICCIVYVSTWSHEENVLVETFYKKWNIGMQSTNKYISPQFPTEMYTRGSKTVFVKVYFSRM